MNRGLDFDQNPALFPAGPFQGFSQVCMCLLIGKLVGFFGFCFCFLFND